MTPHESSPELFDDFVLLRPFGIDDVVDATAACQDPEIVRWTVRIPSPYTQDDARHWISSHAQLRETGAAFNFAIVDRSDGRLGGAISLEHHGDGREGGPIGYWVAPWARNRGLARRALELVSGWAFAELEVDSLYLTTLVGNSASERVAAACRFRIVEEISEYEHPGAAGRYHVKRWVRER